MASKTNAQLAAALAKMLEGGCMTYPNPTETEIEKRKLAFVENRDNLFVLKSSIGATPDAFEAGVLQQLSHKATIKHVSLYPVPSWSESDPPFDFSDFSAALARHCPQVQSLWVQHMLVVNFSVTGDLSKLRTLKLIDPQVQDGKWKVEVPTLTELVMENHTPPVKAFSECLIACPRIESFFAHKYWAEKALPPLYLPNCKDFTFRRGDCVSRLKLYIPRCTSLTLDANYELDDLVLLEKGHAKHKEWNLKPGEQQAPFEVSAENANLGPKAMAALEGSGRLLNDLDDEEEEEEGDFGGLAGMDAIFRAMRTQGMPPQGMPQGRGVPSRSSSNSPRGVGVDPLVIHAEEASLGRLVRVQELDAKKYLVGKTGTVIEVFPQKKRLGVRFHHRPDLELSIPAHKLRLVEDPSSLPRRVKRSKMDETD